MLAADTLRAGNSAPGPLAELGLTTLVGPTDLAEGLRPVGDVFGPGVVGGAGIALCLGAGEEGRGGWVAFGIAGVGTASAGFPNMVMLSQPGQITSSPW